MGPGQCQTERARDQVALSCVVFCRIIHQFSELVADAALPCSDPFTLTLTQGAAKKTAPSPPPPEAPPSQPLGHPDHKKRGGRPCKVCGRKGICPGNAVQMQGWLSLPHACVQAVKKDAAEGGGANEE